MVSGDTPIDYRYLDMDKREFVHSYAALLERLNRGATLRAVTNTVGQCLYAGGNKSFSQCEMLIACRRLTGILR